MKAPMIEKLPNNNTIEAFNVGSKRARLPLHRLFVCKKTDTGNYLLSLG